MFKKIKVWFGEIKTAFTIMKYMQKQSPVLVVLGGTEFQKLANEYPDMAKQLTGYTKDMVKAWIQGWYDGEAARKEVALREAQDMVTPEVFPPADVRNN